MCTINKNNNNNNNDNNNNNNNNNNKLVTIKPNDSFTVMRDINVVMEQATTRLDFWLCRAPIVATGYMLYQSPHSVYSSTISK